MKKISLIILGIIFSSIFTSCSFEKEYATKEFEKFAADELFDLDYNPAKFKIKQKEFVGKWIIIEGHIQSIDEKGKMRIDIVESNPTFSLSCSFDFDSPEKVMDYKKGQYLIIRAKYDYGKEFDYKQIDYTFYFENPEVLLSAPQELDIMWTHSVKGSEERKNYNLKLIE